MEVLERFQTVLDFPDDEVWLRPSARFAEPFEVRTGPPRAVLLGAGALALAALVLALALRWRGRGRRRPAA